MMKLSKNTKITKALIIMTIRNIGLIVILISKFGVFMLNGDTIEDLKGEHFLERIC